MVTWRWGRDGRRSDYSRNGQVHCHAHRKLSTHYALISAADAPFPNKAAKSSSLKGLWVSAGKRTLITVIKQNYQDCVLILAKILIVVLGKVRG